jgi:hypothetical protein
MTNFWSLPLHRRLLIPAATMFEFVCLTCWLLLFEFLGITNTTKYYDGGVI